MLDPRRLAAVVLLMCGLMAGTMRLAIGQGGMTGLYATGVDNSNAPLADSASDPHYTLVSTPAGAGGAAFVTQQHWPVGYGAWMADSGVSKWISPRADESQYLDAPGDYTYQTTFTVTGDPATARITGQAMGDNAVTAIILNGQTVATNVSGGFQAWSSFTISTGFVSGANTLQFVMRNWTADNTSGPQNNPSGFRCEMTGTASPLPPPPDGLTLTQAGINEGFALTVFASKFPSDEFGRGPYGIGFTPTGGVLTSTYVFNQFCNFPTDTDGQDATAVPASSGNGNFALANLGGKLYLSTSGGAVMQVNIDDTGNITQTPIVQGLGSLEGIVGNPATRHLLTADVINGVIYDVDPVTQTSRAVVTGLHVPDGVAVSGDGSTVYVAAIGGNSNHVYGRRILGFSLSTGQQVFDSDIIIGADGCAVGTSGALLNKLYVNTNYGEVYEIDLTTNARTLIASGGSRGDLVTIDPDGSLLLTQSDRICRLRNAHGSFSAGLWLDPASVVGGAPANATSTATLRMSYTAGPSGQSILLSSSNAAAQVPANVTIAAGSNQATFAVNTSAVTATTQVLISATDGTESHSATLSLNPTPPPANVALSSLDFGLFAITGGDSGTATVFLAAPAPAGGVSVSLTSDDPSVQVPASVYVPGGFTKADFPYTSSPIVQRGVATFTASSGSQTVYAAMKTYPAIGLSAVPTGDGKNTLYWQGLKGAVAYNIYRSTTAGGPYVKVNAAPVAPHDPFPGLNNAYLYADTSLTNGTEYFYYVAGVGQDGAESRRSNEDGAIPDPNAIAWDTADAATIVEQITAVVTQLATNPDLPATPDAVVITGPNGVAYRNDVTGGVAQAFAPDTYSDAATGLIVHPNGTFDALPDQAPTPRQSGLAPFSGPRHVPSKQTEIIRKLQSQYGNYGLFSWVGLPPNLSDAYIHMPEFRFSNELIIPSATTHRDAAYITIGGNCNGEEEEFALLGTPGNPGWGGIMNSDHYAHGFITTPSYRGVKVSIQPYSYSVWPEIFMGFLGVNRGRSFFLSPLKNPVVVCGMTIANVYGNILIRDASNPNSIHTSIINNIVYVNAYSAGWKDCEQTGGNGALVNKVRMKRMNGIAQLNFHAQPVNWPPPNLSPDTPFAPGEWDRSVGAWWQRGDRLNGDNNYFGMFWGDPSNTDIFNVSTVTLFPNGQWEASLTGEDNTTPWPNFRPYVSWRTQNADYWETNISIWDGG